MNRNYYAYVITNLVSGKPYHGRSDDPTRLTHDHTAMLKKGKHTNRALQADCDDLGIDGFSFEIVKTGMTKAEAEAFESARVKESFASAVGVYNIRKTGTAPEHRALPRLIPGSNRKYGHFDITQVSAIRARRGEHQGRLADEYGVSQATISQIMTGGYASRGRNVLA